MARYQTDNDRARSNDAAKKTTTLMNDFSIVEMQNSLKHLKNGKAAGLDEILTEEIKNFGPVTTQWVLSLLNACARTHRLPRLWRQARVVALLKPGKDPSSPKSFRPISLLCHLYKLYERLILNRLSPIIEHVLIPEQAGFRPGKSCTAQVLNLTQHIEDGFETGKITGIVLVDLSAAYDTVNHRRLLEKVYNMTRDYRLMCMIRTLLENRRFFVELGGKRSTVVPALGDPHRERPPAVCGHFVNVPTHFKVKLPVISGHLLNADSHLLVVSTCYNGQCKQMPRFRWSFQPKIAGAHPNLRPTDLSNFRAVVW